MVKRLLPGKDPHECGFDCRLGHVDREFKGVGKKRVFMYYTIHVHNIYDSEIGIRLRLINNRLA